MLSAASLISNTKKSHPCLQINYLEIRTLIIIIRYYWIFSKNNSKYFVFFTLFLKHIAIKKIFILITKPLYHIRSLNFCLINKFYSSYMVKRLKIKRIRSNNFRHYIYHTHSCIEIDIFSFSNVPINWHDGRFKNWFLFIITSSSSSLFTILVKCYQNKFKTFKI